MNLSLVTIYSTGQLQESSSFSGASSPTAEPVSTVPATDGTTAQDNFSESDVQDIIQIGFNRTEAIDELRRQNGNKIQAIAALFAKSLKM